MPISVRLARDAVLMKLRSLTPALEVYDGDVPSTPPADGGGVLPYAVLWVSPGRPIDGFLGVEQSRDWTFQVTCAGGNATRALGAVDRVIGALHGQRLLLAPPRLSGRVHLDADPGPMRLDRDVTPPRAYVPLLFRVHLT